MAENRGVQFRIEKNKLNKHATEQSEKLSDLKELKSNHQCSFTKINTLASTKR